MSPFLNSITNNFALDNSYEEYRARAEKEDAIDEILNDTAEEKEEETPEQQGTINNCLFLHKKTL